jgi:hypothetical protein
VASTGKVVKKTAPAGKGAKNAKAPAAGNDSGHKNPGAKGKGAWRPDGKRSANAHKWQR